MKPLYIFDLDGTLALVNHRRHFVEGDTKDWRAFYDACVDDSPNKPVIRTLIGLMAAGADVWIWSGREETVMEQTVIWLTRHVYKELMNVDEFEMVLMMRPKNDYTPDDVLKKGWYDDMRDEDKARLVAIFDDRDKVVKMWRAEGITCFQVAEGNF